jgi:hypothetical protein
MSAPAAAPATSMPIQFEHQTDKGRSWTGETPNVRIVANSLRDPADREAAYYAAGTWRVGDERFRWIAFPTAVHVRFEHEGREWSSPQPLENVRLVDGVVRYGQNHQQHLARYDQPSKCWRLSDDQSLWSTVIFSPVEAEVSDPS